MVVTCTETKVKTTYFFLKKEKKKGSVRWTLPRRDASTASRNQMDELTKKTFHLTLSPCDFRKLKEWSSCDYMSSVLESGHWLKSGRGGRKQENILLRFSCVILISSSSFTHLWKVMFSHLQSCPVWDSPLLPLQLGWMIHWARWMHLSWELQCFITISVWFVLGFATRCISLISVTLKVFIAWKN